MKFLKTITLFTAATSLFSCGSVEKAAEPTFVNRLTEQEIEEAKFTPEVMLKMNRLSGTTLSPDGKSILYSVSVQDVAGNTSYSNLYVKPTAGGEATMVTSGNYKHWNYEWLDNNTIIMLSNRGGDLQLWSVKSDGKDLKQLGKLDGSISAFSISPKGDKIWFTKDVKVEKTKDDIYPDLKKSKSKIYEDLMVRHWSYWLDGSYSHLFVADFDGSNIKNAKDICEGGAWDVPLAPYFDDSEIVWSNNGDKIAYVAKKLSGKEYALSTNSDIYLYDIATGTEKNLTEGMVGYDLAPVFSPDDSRIAFTSMERASNESDKSRLMIVNLSDNSKEYVTSGYDNNAGSQLWSSDGTKIYFISPIQATAQICEVAAKADSEVKILTSGDQDYTSLSLTDGAFITQYTTLSSDNDIFKVSLDGKSVEQLTDVNSEIYSNIKMGKVEKRWVKTTDGKDMLVWVSFPPNFDPTKKYPTLLYCQGGPQSVVSQRWSYRWNFQAFSAQGYIVVAPNRRGLPSFGQEWLDQISGDYSGQNIKDYLSAIDDVAKEPWVDKDNLGCVGASYGGYSTFFLAGNHEKRFKAFISHCGMFNFESFYGATEELWFPNNDLKGTYWSEDPVAKRSFANSPHKFVKNWDTPILIITGLNDFRIPYTESLQAYTAAQLMGVDSKLLVFEDEGHQVFKPQNALVWHHEFFGWLDKYLK